MVSIQSERKHTLIQLWICIKCLPGNPWATIGISVNDCYKMTGQSVTQSMGRIDFKILLCGHLL